MAWHGAVRDRSGLFRWEKRAGAPVRNGNGNGAEFDCIRLVASLPVLLPSSTRVAHKASKFQRREYRDLRVVLLRLRRFLDTSYVRSDTMDQGLGGGTAAPAEQQAARCEGEERPGERKIWGAAASCGPRTRRPAGVATREGE